MNEGRRYVIALGLLETNPEIIRNKEAFEKWSKIRRDAALQTEGLLVGFCLQSGIYEGFSDTTGRVKNPFDFSTISLTEEGRKNGWRIPPRFISPLEDKFTYDGLPAEFVDKSLTYLEDCNRIGGKIVGNWNFKRKMKDVSPDKLILAGIYAPEGRIKELESCVKVLFNRINNSVDYKYSNQTKDMSSERCIVAQATY